MYLIHCARVEEDFEARCYCIDIAKKGDVAEVERARSRGS